MSQGGKGGGAKASPARRMCVKQNQKQSHPLHHTRSGRLHVAAMSLTGDEGSSNSMSFLGREQGNNIERDATRPKGSIVCQYYYVYSSPRRIKP